MIKKIIYKDEFGNKINVNSKEGICTIFNDVLSTCKTKNEAMCVEENIKACIKKCCNVRMQKIQTE